MYFVQFQRKNDSKKRLGIVSPDGSRLTELSDYSCVSSDMTHFIEQDYSIKELEDKMECTRGEPVTDSITLLPPITKPSKVIGIGLNYLCHCEEQNKPKPKEPMFFNKFSTSIVGPTGDIIAHSISNKLDWEVELAVVIGKKAFKVKKENAYDYIFGYTVAQDISARDWQKERNGGQFLIGKSMDTFCPIGPSIVHKSFIKDPHNLNLTSKVNGVIKQDGNTKNMIYKIDEIIEHLTQAITLNPGDIILTGTPAGVGMHRSPPEYLKPGDVVESEIQCIGKLLNTVVNG